MVGAGGGADVQDALDVHEQHRDGRLRHHADVQHRAGSAGIGGSEGLARPRLGEDIAVAPDILLNDQHAAGQHQTDGLRRVSGAQQKGLLGKAPLFCSQTGEHSGEFLLRDTGEKLRRTEHWEKFFHKKSSFVENSTDLLILFYYNQVKKTRRYDHEKKDH